MYNFKKPVVLSVETKNSWFKWNVEKLYFGTYKEEIINSGCYMGEARFLLEMCKHWMMASIQMVIHIIFFNVRVQLRNRL